MGEVEGGVGDVCSGGCVREQNPAMCNMDHSIQNRCCQYSKPMLGITYNSHLHLIPTHSDIRSRFPPLPPPPCKRKNIPA
jgi:hypothetical protein